LINKKTRLYISQRNRAKPSHSVGLGAFAAKIVPRSRSRWHHQPAKQEAVGIFGLLQFSEPQAVNFVIFYMVSLSNYF
jgi:hypothetical protein